MKEIHNATLYKSCRKYVGMEIVQDGNYVFSHQNTYIKSLNLLDITNGCHKEHIPMSNTMDPNDSKTNPPNPSLPSLLPVTGSFRYVADRTRPGVLVAAGKISVLEEAVLSRCLVLAMQILLLLKASPDTVEHSILVLTVVLSGL
jgi:hypothetical protein